MAEHAENGPSHTGRAARSASSRRRIPALPTDTEAALSTDALAGEPGGALTRDLFDEGSEPALALETDDATAACAPQQPEASDAQAPPEPAQTGASHDAAQRPAVEPLPASGQSSAPTDATGNAEPMIPLAHAADAGPSVPGCVPERAASAVGERAETTFPTEIVAAMAAQTRRTKWMLTAAVAALVVTAGVAIAQTLLLASLSADTAAQQQRFDVLMQNQQAALDSVAARLVAPAAAAPVAAAMASVPAAREQASAPPPRPHHTVRAARTPKSSEKAASRTTGSASPKARHTTHQAAKS